MCRPGDYGMEMGRGGADLLWDLVISASLLKTGMLEAGWSMPLKIKRNERCCALMPML